MQPFNSFGIFIQVDIVLLFKFPYETQLSFTASGFDVENTIFNVDGEHIKCLFAEVINKNRSTFLKVIVFIVNPINQCCSS